MRSASSQHVRTIPWAGCGPALIALCLVIVMAASAPARVSEEFAGRLIVRTEHFSYYAEDALSYSCYVDELEAAYLELCAVLEVAPSHNVSVEIHASQRDFLSRIFGADAQRVTSVGMATSREQRILLTSYHDSTTGRTRDEYMRVARHELVHILAPHEQTWLQEGLALFMANQERDFVTPPSCAQDIKDHIMMSITNREAYGYYSWLTRYITGRCGLERYLEFYQDGSTDFRTIGFADIDDFCSQAYEHLRSCQQSSTSVGPAQSSNRRG